MLSKAQKIILYLSAVAALLLGLVLIVPFRTIPGVTLETGKVAIIIELVVKMLILLPILGLTVYPCILKYKQIAGKFERSRSVNVMCYLPLAVYLAGLLTLNLNLLSYNKELLGTFVGVSSWHLAFLVLLFDLSFIVVGFIVLPNVVMKWTRTFTIIFDSLMCVVTLAICAVTCYLSLTYLTAFENDVNFFGVGNPILFFTYVIGLVAFVVVAISSYKMILKDTTELYINFDLQREEIDEVKKVAYRNAYNDITNEFDEYFEERYLAGDFEGTEYEFVTEEETEEEPEEAVEEQVEEIVEEVAEEEVIEEEVVEEETEEEIIEEEVEEEVEEEKQVEVEKEIVVVRDEEDAKRIAELEAQLAELHETHSDKLEDLQEDLEDAAEEAEAAKAEAEEAKVAAEAAKSEAEVAKAEAEALKAAAAAELAEAEAEAARKAALAAEKAKVLAEAKKAIKPSYMNLVNYASALEDDSVTVVANDKETQHKFYFNKKLFLVLTDSNVDYRLTFLASKEEAIDLIIEYPKNVTKATSPKGPHWYKLINKGGFEGEQLKSIIKNALEQHKLILAEAEAEKERIKAEKAAAKKAAKEAAKAQKAE